MKNKLYIIPLVAVSLLVLMALTTGCGGGGKIEVSAEASKPSAKAVRPELKVFLENSGSMDGYMNAGSEMKNAVFDYVSSLKNYSLGTRLYYINSRVIPFSGSLEQYIKTMSAAAFKAAGGDRSQSDMSAMIARVLLEVNDSTVCLFISDCILDLPVADSQKFLTESEIAIRNAVTDTRHRMPQLGVEVLKMSSDFSGSYYYPDGTKEELSNVSRPYYIWIFGNSASLAQLNRDVPIGELKKRGLEDVVAFASASEVEFEVGNKTSTSQVVTADGAYYTVTIKADMNATLQPEEAVTSAKQYKFVTPGVVMESIAPITADGSRYTHLLTFKIPTAARIAQENVVFNSPGVPDWVSASNDESGKRISDNLDKTTGIKSLVDGLAEAYKKDKVSTHFKFNVKR